MISNVRAQIGVVGFLGSIACFIGGCAAQTPPVPTPAPDPTTAVCQMADGTPITSAFQPFVSRWVDAVALVDNTPRIALSAPVGQLQAVRRDVESVAWPPCARRSADLLVEGMNLEINGYLGLMAGHAGDETKTLPDVGTLSYSYLVQTVGVVEANRLFDADFYEAIASGRQTLGTDFGTELGYADGEQPRPE